MRPQGDVWWGWGYCAVDRRRIWHSIALAGFNAAVLTILIVGCEVAFGSWFQPYLPPRSAIVGRANTYQQHFYDPPSVVTYIRDGYGLRGVHARLEDVRLVGLGGSTTDQRFITEGDTWLDVLRAVTGLQVANAGIDGMSSAGHLIAVQQWLHKIPKLRAPLYLHYIGINDAFLPDDKTLADLPGANSWITQVRLRSVIMRGAARAWEQIRGPKPAGGGSAVVHGAMPADNVPEGKSGFDEAGVHRAITEYVEKRYKPNLHRLIDLHQQNGEQAILVSQAAHPNAFLRYGDDVLISVPAEYKSWVMALGPMNAATGQVCRERPHACHFIDVAGKLPVDTSDFYDFVHTTPSGSHKLGRFISRELRALAIPSAGL